MKTFILYDGSNYGNIREMTLNEMMKFNQYLAKCKSKYRWIELTLSMMY